ncbi:amidophosphoribosyltransferase [Deinococcus cellulosilyticus]|uniref:Amidophosphoribosyltransferase n=1 Tax=Deinococcus cellulosilyticus (strain DSM 18568 / NBRC 106333 / KACC 11606 / 5516J-15) TaxID=1223518 RepID=A0A511MWT0_DEIC1|nr:amidophosphoribosyltransferase [Deinococcus cellulosilyticus]GEM45033.1 amidophosphoribosyltransferase [Deinococcus cellulosilyticus NBRC 106333 = KACC 11606]
MLFDDFDKPREECGVFGIYSPRPLNVAWLSYLGMFALQHRGQEAAGMCVSNGEDFLVEKDLGLVTQVFDETRLQKMNLDGANIAIGHVRYSTTGSNLRFNAQPLTVRSNKGILGIAHNGNFVNAREIRQLMLNEGVIFQTTNDTEVMINRIAKYANLDLVDATARVMQEMRGGFAVVIMNRKMLIGLRDPNGVRPLCIGQREDGAYVFASETVALYAVNATFIRDVKPGELVWADENGLHSLEVIPSVPTPCAFEWIYFARADASVDGVSTHEARIRMGQELAKEQPVEADIVVPVPDSGIGAAIGYSRESGIPFDYGLYKNPYAGRSFIAPTQEARELKVKMKLSPTAAVKGKRVVLIDDSIVRGTTSRQIVQLLRDAGATEVHFRVSSPPITHPCYYGIDTAARKELVASTHTVEEIRQMIGADTLAFISEDGIKSAVSGPGLCLACFNGKYPAGVPLENDVNKHALEV